MPIGRGLNPSHESGWGRETNVARWHRARASHFLQGDVEKTVLITAQRWPLVPRCHWQDPLSRVADLVNHVGKLHRSPKLLAMRTRQTRKRVNMTPNPGAPRIRSLPWARQLPTWLRPLVAIMFFLAACSPVDLSRFSDAVRRVADRGIAGPGISDDNRGIGGTGIVGTITGFGSLLINGLTVDFDQETVITNDGVLAAEEALKIGQVVAIEATTRGGKLQARSIAIANAVSGPITAVVASGNQIEVLGQTVSLEPNSLKTPAPVSLRAGQWITVSGLRNAQGTIVASRVSPRVVGGRISVRGPVAARTTTGFTIGRLSVVAPAATRSVTPGRTILAVGALTSAGLRAARVEVAPSVPFDGQVSRMFIEGYVGRREGQKVNISGIQVSVSDGTAVLGKVDNQLTENDRVTIDAVLDNGEVIAETVDASNPIERSGQ